MTNIRLYGSQSPPVVSWTGVGVVDKFFALIERLLLLILTDFVAGITRYSDNQ
ncbi:MAG: hypothetical protein U5N85_20555 [Arcicella sp.]|nr:hypothetical protein [Arcicella sp.]